MVHNRALHERYRRSQQLFDAHFVHVPQGASNFIFSVTLCGTARAGVIMWGLGTGGTKRVVFRITPKGMFIRRKRFPVDGFQLNGKGQVRELREERR